MKIDPDEFRVRPGEKLKLKKWPTHVKPYYASEEQYRKRLAEHVERLSSLQSLLYASDRHALLVIFQAMDAAGKDGIIKHVMSGVNPQGCQVSSFKHPSAEELEHDFLWRTTRFLPERGRIGIFNRSYYEEVLIVRVHPEILRAEKLPDELIGADSIWKERFRSIAGLEDHLSRNGTRILKFFLHLSQEEQRKRFLARLEEPKKNWKFSTADASERQRWNEYMEAYEDMIRHTATKDAPWHVVPADNKWFTRLVVASAIIETLQSLDLHFPKVGREKLKELVAAKKALMSEK